MLWTSHRRTVARLLPFCVLLVTLGSGCRTVVVADCPKPSPEEARSLSEWLLDEPDSPAKDWASRALGRMYPEELEDVRGSDDR